LESIEIALSWTDFPGTTNDEDIWLMSDAAGLPGQIIEAFHITGIPQVGTLMLANSTLHPMLSTDLQYWVLATHKGGIGWNWNNTGDSGFLFTSPPGSPWFANPGAVGAFRVNATALPEPATLFLFAAGGGILATLRRTIR
jgi:hypothetical protein